MEERVSVLNMEELKFGRKSKVNLETQFETYKKYKSDLIENGIVKSASSAIYKKLSDELGMTAKAIHISVTRNANAIFADSNVKTSKRKYPEDTELISDVVESGTWIEIQLTDDDRAKFFDATDAGGQVKLKRGWTNRLFELIASESKSDCCFNVRRGRVEVATNEIAGIGYCSECHAAFHFESMRDLSVLRFRIDDGSEPHTYTKKRRIAHDKKLFYEEKLKNDTAFNVRNAISYETEFEVEPRDLPKANTLCKLKSRANARSYLHENPCEAVRMMKYLPEYGGTILVSALMQPEVSCLRNAYLMVSI